MGVVGKRREVSVSMAKANVFSMVTVLPLVALFYYSFVNRWGFASLSRGVDLIFEHVSLSLFCLLIGVIVHELIHGFTWSLLGGHPHRAIRYGIQWRTLTPFAHCTMPLPARTYRVGALLPGLLLGVVPVLAGIDKGNSTLFVFGLLFTAAAGGDFLIVWLLRGVHPASRLEDHPTRAGCIVLEAEPSPVEVVR